MSPSLSADHAGKVAVVTGGGGVLCAELARALSRAGARIAILDLNLEAAETVAASLRAEGGAALAFAANVLDRPSLEAAAGAVLEQLGPCDILINGAGGNHPKGTTTREQLRFEDFERADPEVSSFFDLDPAGIRFVFDLNVLGAILPSQVFGKQMVGRMGCSILNISSMNAFRPLTRIPAYSAAKAAVSNFTQWLAVHFAPVGIRVNAIAPGYIMNEPTRALAAAGSFDPSAINKRTPMGRMGSEEEVAQGIAYLLSSEAAGYVTGHTLEVNGGWTAYGYL